MFVKPSPSRLDRTAVFKLSAITSVTSSVSNLAEQCCSGGNWPHLLLLQKEKRCCTFAGAAAVNLSSIIIFSEHACLKKAVMTTEGAMSAGTSATETATAAFSSSISTSLNATMSPLMSMLTALFLIERVSAAFFAATSLFAFPALILTAKVTVCDLMRLAPAARRLRPAAAGQYFLSMSMSPSVSPAARLASMSARICASVTPQPVFIPKIIATIFSFCAFSIKM